MTEPAFLRTSRAAYDTVAPTYAERARGVLADKPLDRALLSAFAESVRAAGAGPVADIGCGPGNVTAHLRDRGLDAFGIDLSPGMVAQARLDYPGLRFEVGSMTALDLPDGTLGGIVAWFSLIHLPPERRWDVFAEFHRVLAPSGQVLLGFQAGDGHRHLTEWFGHEIALDTYRLPPDRTADQLAGAGLPVYARLLREPDADGVEKVQRGYLMARKPAPEGVTAS